MTNRGAHDTGPMLTVFTIPKAFVGHIGVIQRNAIASWRRLPGAPAIMLCGDDDGTKNAAREFNAIHVPDIERRPGGEPLLNSIFTAAKRVATTPILCYVNADIILLEDFTAALFRLPMERCVMIGRRTDLDVARPIDFANPQWAVSLRSRAEREGELQHASAIDYFAFPAGSAMTNVPPFAVGRTAWDNWLLYHALKNGLMLVDATPVVTVIHQKHDYGHVVGGKEAVWNGEEAVRNRRLARDPSCLYTVDDASHALTREGLLRRRNWNNTVHCRLPTVALPCVRAARFVRTRFLRLVGRLAS